MNSTLQVLFFFVWKFNKIHWIKSKINNGISEGLNSIVQAAKRKARGYGKKHFSTMALLLIGKLDFTKINPLLATHFGSEPFFVC